MSNFDQIETIRVKAIEDELKLIIREYSNYYKDYELQEAISKYCSVYFQNYMNIRIKFDNALVYFYVSMPSTMHIVQFSIDMRNDIF